MGKRVGWGGLGLGGWRCRDPAAGPRPRIKTINTFNIGGWRAAGGGWCSRFRGWRVAGGGWEVAGGGGGWWVVGGGRQVLGSRGWRVMGVAGGGWW